MPSLMRKLKASTQGGGRTAMRRLRTLSRDCRGVLMLEAFIAVLTFSMVGMAVLVGLQTVHTSGFRTETQSTAENIARNQMEYVFSLPYQEPPSSYPTISVPQGYVVTCEAEEYVLGDPNLEKVVVTVTFSGREELVLETLRSE